MFAQTTAHKHCWKYNCLKKNSFNRVFILTSFVSKILPAAGLKVKRLRVISCHEELNWTSQSVSSPLFFVLELPFWEYSWNFVFISSWPLCFRSVDLLMTTDKIYWMEETNNWNPVNTVTNGPKKFGRINEGFFTRKCMAVFARRPKKWP